MSLIASSSFNSSQHFDIKSMRPRPRPRRKDKATKSSYTVSNGVFLWFRISCNKDDDTVAMTGFAFVDRSICQCTSLSRMHTAAMTMTMSLPLFAPIVCVGCFDFNTQGWRLWIWSLIDEQ
jgi:hypothetical protein